MRYLLLLGLVVVIWADVDTINPIGDVYIITAGGGAGANVFLKFDISSISPGVNIDSVFLECFIWEIVPPNWNGNVNFWNVNSQIWTESDSAKKIWQIPTSDSTFQNSGFGINIGWSRSVDLKNIFNRDYQVSNTFCSIKMKDPEDPTFVVPWDAMPYDSDDTLDIGWQGYGEIYFYPHEHGSDIPRLIVYYTPSGIENVLENKIDICRVVPNPFKLKTTFYAPNDPNGISLSIYDHQGRLVRTFKSRSGMIVWDGCDNHQKQLPSGIYSYVLEDNKTKGKVCLIR